MLEMKEAGVFCDAPEDGECPTAIMIYNTTLALCATNTIIFGTFMNYMKRILLKERSKAEEKFDEIF